MRCLVFTLTLFFTFSLYSQRIEHFNVLQANNVVSVRFSIKAGPECAGWTILHGADSLNMTMLWNEPGICGGYGDDNNKSYSHATPLVNQLNYYRVQLDVQVERSSARSVFVGKNTSSVFVSPNPVYDFSVPVKGRIMNGGNLRMQGMLLSQLGVIRQHLDVNVVEGQFELDVSSLVNGFYVLWLTDGEQLFPGKLIIYR